MARTEQSAIGDPAQARIGLFMRAESFAGEDLIAVSNEQKIDSP